MIPKYLSEMWASFAPELANHLWQSTVFAVAAWLLTLTLRKNPARTRYLLWLAASAKFLIPFSLLIGMGSRLAWPRGGAGAQAEWSFAMQEMSQPFGRSAIAVTVPQASLTGMTHLIPELLIAAWFCGFVAVVFVWCGRWRRISLVLRGAVQIDGGREVKILRRLEQVRGSRSRIGVRLSRASLEPGIFGIVRPILLWPEGISERLSDGQLEAILAHEVRHVRRKDNLTATIHMVVEGIFWFHPLVWWLGARLVEERERACDEEVLEMGNERQVYAESILKVCEFYVGSPLACVAGVTGADLKKRMVSIMTGNVVRKLDFSRKLLLSAAAFMVFALPIEFGLMNGTSSRAQAQAQVENSGSGVPAYKSVSIKASKTGAGMAQPVAIMFNRDGFFGRNITLKALVREAYGVQNDQIVGPPDWAAFGKYDIEAKVNESSVEGDMDSGGIGIDKFRLMVRQVLADRFKLTVHTETKQLPIYALVVAEGGPRFQEAKPGSNLMNMGPGELVDQGATLQPLVEQLSMQLGRSVVDKTGLTGHYDFTLKWTPAEKQPDVLEQDGAPSPSSSSIVAAVQEQLGLKLEPQTAPMQVFVIDHVEQPTEN
jgi:uncharacterized protein (TIGR03435 family)